VDGTPDPSVALFDEDGTRNIPRRFAQGYFKGGEEGSLLFVRVLNGMPGTPMPSFKDAFSPADIWDVVHYLQRLSLHDKPRG
jgi:cytochrome c oxidase cbb3-type subunit I/II